MDKKDLKGEVEEGKGKDIIYEIDDSEKEPLVIKEARAAYSVDRIYTYEDYLNWPSDERIELIDGKIHYMSAPTKTHQTLLGRLSNRFGNYLHGKSCDYYFAPFDVRIDLDLGKDSVVQPDLVVVCDDEKLTEKGLDGSPDLVIEILSKSTARRDRIIKYNKYLEASVKEYWIIDPDREEVVVNLLRTSKYTARTYVKGDVVQVNVLDDLYINVTDLFDGSRGADIVEIKEVREEERVKAEADKLEISKKLLQAGMRIGQVVEITGLNLEVIQELVKSE